MSNAATAADAATAATHATGATIASQARASSTAAAAAAATLAGAGTGGSTGPWWRHPMMWLVVGGPSLVVVASFITLTLAVRHADPVVEHGNQAGSARVSAADAGTEDAARAQTASFGTHGTGATGGTFGVNGANGAIGASVTAKAASVDDPALQPAMRARNHAATGGKEH